MTVWDIDGDEIADLAPTFSWSDESVAAVYEEGPVIPAGNESATITLDSGDVSESVAVTVEQVADAVEVPPDEVTLTAVGASEELSA